MAAQRKYPEELRERAVKMVFEIRERDGMDRPGNLGGSDSWEDAGSWRHSGSTPRSCASAR